MDQEVLQLKGRKWTILINNKTKTINCQKQKLKSIKWMSQAKQIICRVVNCITQENK